MNKILVTGIMFFLVSCASTNPAKNNTAKQYYNGGMNYIKQNKWDDARSAFGESLNNAKIGNLPKRNMATIYYAYGRSSGAICDWEESQKGLLEALDIDQSTNGPTHMSLYELARMYHAKGDIKESVNYFRKAKIKMDDFQAMSRDTMGYADFLSEYSHVLVKQNDLQLSKSIKEKENEIRRIFKGDPPGSDKTPYGKFCPKNSVTHS